LVPEVSLEQTNASVSGPPPIVVVVGERTRDFARIGQLIDSGYLVILANDRGVIRQWLPEILGGPEPEPQGVIRKGNLEIDLAKLRVRWMGRPVQLTRHELEILARLAWDPGRVWTFRDLVQSVWGRTYFGDASTLHSAIKRLRWRLRRAGVDLTIESVRGTGFRLA
jgi:two-component system, OmpR family, response regulator MtrA